MIRATAVACLLVILSSGCATRGSVRQVAADVRATRAELAALRQAQEGVAVQLGELSAAVRTSRATTEGLQKALTTTAADVAHVTTRVEATEEAVKQVRELVASRAAAAPPPPPPASPPEPPQDRRVGSAENTYAAGLANFRAREYGQAVLDFVELVTRHPKHPLAPSAQFWIGEAYFRQHDYRQALSEFQKVIDWESPNPKAADALVKIGLCYGHLREESRARDAWQRVLREFPGSPAAMEARQLLASHRAGPQRSPSLSPSGPR
jgi:tol-pal system protein YbgF